MHSFIVSHDTVPSLPVTVTADCCHSYVSGCVVWQLAHRLKHTRAIPADLKASYEMLNF